MMTAAKANLSVLLLLTAVVSGSIASDVPPTWKKLQVPNASSRLSLGGQEFYLTGLDVDWYTARQTCIDAGLRLLQINSNAKQSLVQSVLNLEKVIGFTWIGASDEAVEGRWRWADNSLVLYSNWDPWGNPNAPQKNCAFIVGTGHQVEYKYKWIPEPCLSARVNDFICETY